MAANTANTANITNTTTTTATKAQRRILFQSSWITIAKLYWFLFLNGIATVIILYGLSLIIRVGVR